jgi:hypothetical protein
MLKYWLAILLVLNAAAAAPQKPRLGAPLCDSGAVAAQVGSLNERFEAEADASRARCIGAPSHEASRDARLRCASRNC